MMMLILFYCYIYYDNVQDMNTRTAGYITPGFVIGLRFIRMTRLYYFTRSGPVRLHKTRLEIH